MLLSSLNKVGGTKSNARNGGRLKKVVGKKVTREVGERTKRQWYINVFRRRKITVENSRCVVVRVRGSLVGIRIANKRELVDRS